MRLSLFAAAVALAVAGCAESTDPARIVTFAANPSSITIGSSAALSWSTTGAESLNLKDGEGKEIAIAGADGTVEVRPVATTTYVLTVTGADGDTARAEAKVEVVRGKTVIERFAASPDTVGKDGKTTLWWIVRGADFLVLEDDAGQEIELEPGQREIEITPARDTTYTLTAVGSEEVSAQATVTIAPAPTVTLTANPKVTEAGGPVTLSWTSEHADRLELRSSAIGNIMLTAPSGTYEVNPVVSTRYEMVAYGLSGNVLASVVVGVTPRIDVFEVVTPAPTREGRPVELRWAITGATSASIVADGATRANVTDASDLTDGGITLTVGPSGIFELVASNSAGETRATARIGMTQMPLIELLEAPTHVTAEAGAPALVTVRWAVDGADAVELETIPGGPIAIEAGATEATVAVERSTIFSLAARNDFGTTFGDVHVEALPLPAVQAFFARPTRVGMGQEVELVWNGRASERIEIYRDGDLAYASDDAEGGTWTDTVVADTLYELRVYNRLGAFDSEDLLVTVGAPIIGSFRTLQHAIPPGGDIEFKWASEGGTTLEVLDSEGAAVCRTTDIDRIWRGGCDVTAGTTLGDATYTLRVTDESGGIDEWTATVQVTDGPIVLFFRALVAEVTAHDPVPFEWSVYPGSSGGTPTIEIAGSGPNLENPLSVSAAGSGVMFPLEAGAQRYTLAATTPGTTPGTAFVDVMVHGIPEVELAAVPSIVDADTPEATLQWTSTGGSALWIYDESVDPPEEIWSTTDAGLIASGSLVVEPQAAPSVTYRVEIANPMGRAASDTVTVLVDPAQATSLAAQPDEILEGEETTIAWTTLRSTERALTFDGLPGLAVAKEFVDVSELPGGAQLTLSAGGGHGKWGEITFPASFAFPFAGVARTAARVTTSGFVTFDLTSTSASTTPALLPAAAAPHVNLAPFWSDLDGNTGSIWWAAIEEDGQDAIVIQWKGIAFFASAAQPSSLDFEVVLFGDGSFDYRYGSMLADGAPAFARGSQASIGIQGAGEGASRSFNAEVAGGLQGRAFGFPAFPLAASGDWTVRPAAGADIGLLASNAHSDDELHATLAVWPAVKIVSASLATQDPIPGQPFTIDWVTEHATSVTIEDEGGTVRCTAAPQELEEGSCTITEAAFGDKVYTLIAEGGIDVATRTIAVPVFTPYSIDAFGAGPGLVEIGEDVTVSWNTTNAATMTLTANGTPVDLTGKSLVTDSLVLHPQVPTTYLLTIESAEGRSTSATRVVQVRTAFANSITATATQLLPGQETTIGWSTAGTEQVTVTDGPLAPPVEVTTAKPFIDLEARGTATELTSLVPTSPTSSERTGTVALQLPFDFPYFGEFHSELRVVVSGYISFDMNHVTGTTAAEFPSPTKKEAHISPFMSQLTLKPSGAANRIGKIFWEHIDDGVEDYVVIQWSHIQYISAARNPSDLNFQVVLYRDGSFDLRYGPNTGPTTSTDGTWASIGYQDPTGTQGYYFSAYNVAVPDGLVSRSFHFVPHAPANGSMTVSPDESKTYSVCVTGAGGYSECQSKRVVVLLPGDVAVTEVMPEPQGGDDARWFEIRNLTADTLNLGGMTVESVSGVPFTVGALTLPPGGYATFAESSAVQGFTPTVVTGPDVVVGIAGSLTLKMHYPEPDDPEETQPAPLLLASLNWSSTYPFQANQSMYLDPTFHYRGTTSNSVPTLWCPGDALYDGVNLGSPGAHGGSCKSQHYVADWQSTMPFIDIEATGLLLSQITANNGVGQMPGGLGFTMPFFGGTVSDLWASASGFVSFGPLTSDITTGRDLGILGDPKDGLVAAQWENFEMPARLNAKFLFERRTVGGRQVTILQWTRFQRRLKPDNYTFQVQLWSDGDIVIANREMVALAGKGGQTATIGIEAPLGMDSITYLRNDARLDPGQVLLFKKK